MLTGRLTLEGSPVSKQEASRDAVVPLCRHGSVTKGATVRQRRAAPGIHHPSIPSSSLLSSQENIVASLLSLPRSAKENRKIHRQNFTEVSIMSGPHAVQRNKLCY